MLRSVFILLTLLSMSLAAQTGGSLQGVVTDPSGGAVPRAVVTVLNGTTAVSTTKSDNEGRYQTRDLAAGKYTIRVEAAGFAPFEAESVQVLGERLQVLDVPLSLRAESQ